MLTQEEFQAMVQGRGTQVESSGLLELKRQNCKYRDTKNCLTDYWRGQTYGEREREGTPDTFRVLLQPRANWCMI